MYVLAILIFYFQYKGLSNAFGIISTCFFCTFFGLSYDVSTLVYFGHAPWSNAYEAIVYVATMFFGLAFDIKSKLTVASAAFVINDFISCLHELD
jgi:ABC-type transport system involved in cytochrome c biogenesis permease subunit